MLTGGGIELTVDPKHGGQAVRLSLDGKNVLVAPGSEAGPPYSAELEGSALVLKSAAGLGQRYRLDTARRAVEVTYTLTNSTSEPLRSTLTEAQRVPSAAGLTFFASPQQLLPGSTLKLDLQQPFVWLSHDQLREPRLLSASLESVEGWVANVNDGILFVKDFGEITKANIVITSEYDPASKQRPWVELAEQVALELPPGGSFSWNVRWFLRKLPSRIATRAGNQELLGFVRGVIQ